MRRILLFLPFVLLFTQSCKVLRPNLMLKTKPDFNYDKLSDSLSRLEYKIAPNDNILYRISTNDGFKLIDLASGTNNQILQNNIEITVESDGTAKMPMVGYIKLEGYSLREAEKMLEDKYSKYYVDPFVTLRVNNKRVIVFPGNGGTARVMPLTNNYTSVMEVIALAGGITEDGKAYKIKLIRNNGIGQKPNVYLLDLSKIEGIGSGNTRVLANDIIYVEPRYRVARTLVNELTPLVTLISTTFILYSFFIK